MRDAKKRAKKNKARRYPRYKATKGRFKMNDLAIERRRQTSMREE